MFDADAELPPWRCPICNKKRKGVKGVVHHMLETHKNPKHHDRISEWIANPTRTGLSQ